MKDSAKNKSTLKKVMETPFAFNLIWAVIVTIVLISLVLLWLNIYTRHNEAEVVPNVKGMGATSAVYLLESAGLHVKIKGIGRVKQQSLTPGSKFKPGQTVFLTLG